MIKGFIVGVLAGIPVGPIGSIILQRLIYRGSFYGLVSGLGSAAADLLFCATAVYGLTFVEIFLVSYGMVFRIVGGAVIIIAGIKIFITKIDISSKPACKKGLINAFASTFLIALSNPLVILYFASLITHIGIAGTSLGKIISFEFFTGVFTGALFWWIAMTFTVRLIRKKLKINDFSWLNKILGVIIIVLGIAIII